LLRRRLDSGWWYKRELRQHWGGSSSHWKTDSIVATLKAGNYLMRDEIIALYSEYKPQFYPECVKLEV
ncbi:hypothetical protein BJ878DRAFT_389740, partial [Calycina marina]